MYLDIVWAAVPDGDMVPDGNMVPDEDVVPDGNMVPDEDVVPDGNMVPDEDMPATVANISLEPRPFHKVFLHCGKKTVSKAWVRG